MAWPFMPRSSEKIWAYLGCEGSIEGSGLGAVTSALPAGRALVEPAPVYTKVEIPKDDDAEEVPKEGEYADFRKLDLRVGKIMSAEDHPDAEKLFVMKVDIGEGSPRQIVAGLRAYYTREQMVGRDIILVSNLKPAKLRGLMSEGMLLAADDEALGGKSVQLLRPSKDVPIGTKFNSGLENSSAEIEYKEFQKVRMIVSKAAGGKLSFNSMNIDVPAGSPERVAVIIDGENANALSDGKGCTATVDSDMIDGANVR
jgi:methionyl-tRNA synthetase